MADTLTDNPLACVASPRHCPPWPVSVSAMAGMRMMGTQATKLPSVRLSTCSAGRRRPSNYLTTARVLNGAMKRSACTRRCVIVLASKRSSRLCGSSPVLAGGMKRSHTDCQNRVNGKISHHHLRQRLSVTGAMRSRSRSARDEALPGGETSIHTTARYTRRPAKRTEAEVVRSSHRPQMKLSRGGILLPDRDRAAARLAWIVRYVQRSPAGAPPLKPRRSGEFFIDLGKETKKRGLLHNGVAHLGCLLAW